MPKSICLNSAQHRGHCPHSTGNKVRDKVPTAQHSTAQHSTAQHSTAQHSTAQRLSLREAVYKIRKI